MNLVIDNILDENILYYQTRKTSLVGRVLINGRGSIRRRNFNGRLYTYLRRNFKGRKFDEYVGPHESHESKHTELYIKKTRKFIEELRGTRHALKRLGAKKMNQEDFTQHIKDLFVLMEKEGLWDEGLQLVGSWCFKVYQNFFGVEHYPERTIDVDFAISIPYRGNPVEIGTQLKRMGFEEEFNRADGSIKYVSSQMQIEFLKSRKGDGKKEEGPYIRNLDIAPQALPFLNILLEHPRTETLRDLGKITIPSMGAFLVHKLIVAPKRKEEWKKEKDYRQAYFVAKAVLRDKAEMTGVTEVFKGLHKKRQKMMLKSSREAGKYVPGAVEVFQEVWETLEIQ